MRGLSVRTIFARRKSPRIDVKPRGVARKGLDIQMRNTMRTFVAGLLAACLLGSVASAADQPLPGSPDAKLSAQIKKEADRQEAQQKGTSRLLPLLRRHLSIR